MSTYMPATGGKYVSVSAPVHPCTGAGKINQVFSGRKLIPVFFQPEDKYGIFLMTRLIPVFSHGKNNSGIFNSGIFQLENNSSIFSPEK